MSAEITERNPAPRRLAALRLPLIAAWSRRIARALLHLLATLTGLVIAMAVALLVFGAVVVYSGAFDVSVTADASPGARMLFDTALKQSVSKRAARVTAPNLDDITRVIRGVGIYQVSCEACHRAPGAERSAIASALSPSPADLTLAASDWSPQELFWVVKKGIRMSAMPAWEQIYTDDELWDIVSAVSRLPRLSAAEYEELLVQSGHAQQQPN